MRSSMISAALLTLTLLPTAASAQRLVPTTSALALGSMEASASDEVGAETLPAERQLQPTYIDIGDGTFVLAWSGALVGAVTGWHLGAGAGADRFERKALGALIGSAVGTAVLGQVGKGQTGDALGGAILGTAVGVLVSYPLVFTSETGIGPLMTLTLTQATFATVLGN